MNIYETIKTRRSVRSYRENPISEETLKKILEAARLAPSAHNAQDYKLIIVQDAEKRKAITNAASEQQFITEAPVVIVGVSLKPNHIMSNDVPAYAVDLAIVLDHITLAAVEEGLGTCWICAFSQEEVRQILNIPEKYKVVALLTLGTPYDDPGVKSRKKLKELVCYENFSEENIKKNKNE